MTQTPPPGADKPASAGQSRPPGTIRIGSVAGIDVLVTSSWFIVAALISFTVAPRIDQVEPGLGALKYVAGLVFAIVLYLSVLLHEASHAIMAQRFGFNVNSITLHFLGGMTEIDGSAQRPRQEFWIAVVGPLTSIAVGVAAVGTWFLLPEGLVRVAIEGLAGANLLIGVLNLVPGLPLDGGRVLKAAVWGATGDATRGTIVAGWGGRLTAIAVLGWPLIQREVFDVPPTMFDYLLVIVLGLFLWTGATAAMSHARLRSRLPHLVATPARSPYPRRPRGHAVGRGRTPRAGDRRRQHRRPSPRRGARPASSARRPCSPRRRSAGRGSRSAPWPAPSRRASRCPRPSPARS